MDADNFRDSLYFSKLCRGVEKYEQLSKRTLVLWDKPSNKGFVFPGLFHILLFLGGGGCGCCNEV